MDGTKLPHANLPAVALFPARSPALSFALALALLAGGCAGGGLSLPGGGPRDGGDAGRAAVANLQQRSLLLLMADQKRFELFTVETAMTGGPALREALAVALGRSGDPRGVTYLGQLTAAAEPEVRRAAVFAFGEMELERADAERAARSLLLVAVEDDREAAALAVEALGKLGVSVTEVVSAMTRAELPEAERWARLLPALYRFDEAAMVPLAKAGLAAMTAARTANLTAEGPAMMPGEAVEAVAADSAAADSAASTSLTEGEAGSSAALRRRAAFALSREPKAESLAELRAMLGDPDPRVRAWGARALGLIGEATDLPALRELAAADGDPGPRVQALRAGAGLLGGEAAASPQSPAEATAWRRLLADLLDHPDPLLRLEALDRSAPWLAAGAEAAGSEAAGTEAAGAGDDGESGEARAALVAALEARVDAALEAAPAGVASGRTASGEDVPAAALPAVSHPVRITLAEGAAALLALADGAPAVLRSPQGVRTLRAAAASSDLLRATAATAMGHLGAAAGPASAPSAGLDWGGALREMLADPDPAVASAAAAALLAATDPASPDAPDLALALLAHPDSGVRGATFGWLEEHPVVPYVELTRALQRSMAGGTLEARLAAVPALAARGEAEATERGGVVTVLEKLATDTSVASTRTDASWLLRRTAGEALARLDRPVPPAGHPRGRSRPAVYEQIVLRTARPRLVEVETEAGTLRLSLDCPRAPQTCLNFLQLAGQGLFDGVPFHRVVPDFVVQGGDPRGDGTGGPGYAIRDEINRRRYVRGTLGMALSGADTGGSQFFLTHSPQPHLDGAYTAFGHLVTGHDVLDRITRGTRILAVREAEP